MSELALPMKRSLSPIAAATRPAAVLQRRCACPFDDPQAEEETDGVSEHAAEGQQSRLNPVDVSKGLHSPGGLPEAALRAEPKPRFGHDFSQIPVNWRGRSMNGAEDEEGQESVNLAMPIAVPPTRSQLQQQVGPRCPSGTRVDTTIDLTPTGLQAGFLSAYGIIARMRVIPDRTPWDGTQIVERVTPGSSTCPAGLTRPGPCSGNSTFTVGVAAGRSAVAAPQPAMHNCFYDYHTSRSRTVSFLHDPTRNPTGMNACETVCQQQYSCNGVPIGFHTITRRFRKGVFNGHDVTIVDVTKSNPVSDKGDFPVRTLPAGQEYASREAEPEPGGAA
jgi:hypothetical protein